MKKYLKLTTNQIIRHFLLKDSTLALETDQHIGEKINELRSLKSSNCVSITLPTHRTRPDSEKDVIVLKNLVNEAERSLRDKTDKRTLATIMDNIHQAQQAIDFSINLDSMVLYANEHFSSVVKLPVPLKQNILIADDFDLRPLYITRQQNRSYYILSVSKKVIRLFEAFNDRILHETHNGDFPFENKDYFVSSPIELAQDDFQQNQFKEYFNDSDKMFQKYYNENPLPLVLMGDVKTVAYYREQMDDRRMLIAEVQGSYDNTPLHEIADAVKPVIEKYRESVQQDYRAQIDNAVSASLLVTDLSEAYRAALEGNVQTLFISSAFEAAGTVSDDGLMKVAEQGTDLVHILLNAVSRSGGQVTMTESELPEPHGGVALIKRF